MNSYELTIYVEADSLEDADGLRDAACVAIEAEGGIVTVSSTHDQAGDS